VQQEHVDHLGFEPLETARDACPKTIGRKIVPRNSFGEAFADFRCQNDLAAPGVQKPANPFLTQAVRGRRIDVIDAHIEEAIEKLSNVIFGRQLIRGRVFRLLIPSDFESAEADRRNGKTGATE